MTRRLWQGVTSYGPGDGLWRDTDPPITIVPKAPYGVIFYANRSAMSGEPASPALLVWV